MSASPYRPAQPVAKITAGPSDQGREQVLDLVASPPDQPGRWRMAGLFSHGGHHQEGMCDHGQGGPVNARRAAVTAHLLPRPLQDIPAVDLVEQRVELPPGIGLGRPVKRMLQGADSVPTDSRQGGPSPENSRRRVS